MGKDSSSKVIFILGPTAIGKTAIAIDIAQRIDGEIISADSRQIYKGMEIGTSSPINPPVKHHLINFLEPTERFNAVMYAKLANEKINEIQSRGKRVLIVGGTGLYIRALLGKFFIGETYNEKIREQLKKRFNSGENLWNELNTIDPELAKKLHPNDFVRIERGLEVYYTTGKTMTSLQKSGNYEKPDFDYTKFILTMDREKLNDRINRRVDNMIASGWIDEVKGLIEKGIPPNSPGLESIGYKEIILYLKNELNLNEAIEQIKLRTRQYAKRQITWFKAEKEGIFIDMDFIGNENIEIECKRLFDSFI